MASNSKVQWRITLQPANTSITNTVLDLELFMAVNREASRCTVWLADDTGSVRDSFPRAQRVEVEYSTDSGSTWTRKFAGLALNVDRTNRFGQPAVEVTLFGYDHLLRRRGIFENFSSVTVSSALQTLVEDWTGVTWNASNVTVANDVTFTRNFDGDRVDRAIAELAALSGNEDFGVNDDLEFFFEVKEETSAPDDLLDADIIDYNFPEKGQSVVNQVRVFYDTGGLEKSVLVEDRVDQRDMKTALNAPRRIVFLENEVYPEIGTEDAAVNKAREILDAKGDVFHGDVTTIGGFDLSPGESLRLQITERGIDDDYRIAAIQYSYVSGVTEVSLAQNVPGVEDMLVAIQDELDRIELRDADETGDTVRFLDFPSGFTVAGTCSASQTPTTDSAMRAGFDFSAGDTAGFFQTGTVVTAGFGSSGAVTYPASSCAVTAAALNMFRDTWQGASNTAITHMGVGTSGKLVTVGDSTLTNEIGDRVSVTVSANGSYAFDLDATLTAGGQYSGEAIREVGFFDASSGGNMYARVTFDPPISHSLDVDTDFTFTGTLDSDGELVGVMTNQGKTASRNLFIGDAADTVDEMHYGTGTTAEAETDTALETDVHTETTVTQEDRGLGVTSDQSRLGTGEANANTLSEISLEDTTNGALSRVTFEGIDKDSSFELVGNIEVSWRAIVS